MVKVVVPTQISQNLSKCTLIVLRKFEQLNPEECPSLSAVFSSRKDLLNAQREYKKKKAEKKRQRQKQLEEEREVEKNKWLSFNAKVCHNHSH